MPVGVEPGRDVGGSAVRGGKLDPLSLGHRLVEGHPVVRLARGAVQPVEHDAVRRADRDGRIQGLHLFDDGSVLVTLVREMDGPIDAGGILVNQADRPDLQPGGWVGQRQRAAGRGVADLLGFDLAGPMAEELRGGFPAIDEREWKTAIHGQIVQPKLRSVLQHHPGIGPIALVPTTAVAGIVHDQVELLRTLERHVDCARCAVGSQDLGGPNLFVPNADVESAGRLRVVHVSIQPDHGQQVTARADRAHPQGALRVHADAAWIDFVAQPQRSAGGASAYLGIPQFILMQNDQAFGRRGWEHLLGPLAVQGHRGIQQGGRCRS